MAKDEYLSKLDKLGGKAKYFREEFRDHARNIRHSRSNNNSRDAVWG